MSLRYEGVRFSDGSIAVRRIAADPCERSTITFEGMRELEEDIGSAEVTWIVDRGAGSTTPPPPQALQESALMCCSACWALWEGTRDRKAECWSYDAKCCVCGIERKYCTGPVYADEREWLAAKRRGSQPIGRMQFGTPLYVGDGPAPPPINVVTEEDWRKHVGGRPPAWFLASPAEKPVPIYVGDGHPAVRAAAAEPDHYEPTEEVDEP